MCPLKEKFAFLLFPREHYLDLPMLSNNLLEVQEVQSALSLTDLVTWTEKGQARGTEQLGHQELTV